MKVAQSCPTLCDPMDCTVHGILQARILGRVAFPFSRGSLQPRIEPRSPALQMDPLPIEPPEKPKNTGVDSLSLLQWIFPTQESNRGLLHCRWFLYQLSYQGSPILLQGMSRTLCAVTVGPCWFFILNIAVCTCYTFKERKYRAKISV